MLVVSVSTLLVILMTSQCPGRVSGHGRLWTPPGRSTMWRKGYPTPHNYDDNALYCGGFQHQLTQGYKCGLCGDPYDSNRPNEAGGKFAKGTVTGKYRQGQEVKLQVQITANHKGWFEFKVCPTNDPSKRANQTCLDQNVLQLSDGTGSKLDVAKYGTSTVTIPIKLPSDLSCDFCVLQWRYHAGNNWGTDKESGHSCVGCGPQEEFYGCADIRIKPTANNTATTTTTTTNPTTTKPTTQVKTKTTTTESTRKTTPKTTEETTTEKRETTTTNTKFQKEQKKLQEEQKELQENQEKMQKEQEKMQQNQEKMQKEQEKMQQNQEKMQKEQKELQQNQKEMQHEQKEMYLEQKELNLEQKEMQHEQKEMYFEQKELNLEQKELNREHKEIYEDQKQLKRKLRQLKQIQKQMQQKQKQ